MDSYVTLTPEGKIKASLKPATDRDATLLAYACPAYAKLLHAGERLTPRQFADRIAAHDEPDRARNARACAALRACA